MVTGTIISIETPSPGNCQPSLKSNPPAYEMETVPHQVSRSLWGKQKQIGQLDVQLTNVISA